MCVSMMGRGALGGTAARPAIPAATPRKVLRFIIVSFLRCSFRWERGRPRPQSLKFHHPLDRETWSSPFLFPSRCRSEKFHEPTVELADGTSALPGDRIPGMMKELFVIRRFVFSERLELRSRKLCNATATPDENVV